jgi:hypothetical protein
MLKTKLLPKKTEGTKTKVAIGADKLVTTQIWELKNLMSLFSGVSSLPVHFEFFAIFSFCLHFAKFVCLLGLGKQTAKTWLGVEK